MQKTEINKDGEGGAMWFVCDEICYAFLMEKSIVTVLCVSNLAEVCEIRNCMHEYQISAASSSEDMLEKLSLWLSFLI